MFPKASHPNTRKRRLLAQAAVPPSNAAAQPATASFTDSRGLVPRHLHAVEYLPEFSQQPDLLLSCDGDNGGRQEGILVISWRASRGIAGVPTQYDSAARIPALPRSRRPACPVSVFRSSSAYRSVSHCALRHRARAVRC